MSMNLFLALAEEHKQRTGHDIFAQAPLDTTSFTCHVCLHLHTEKREQEEAERKWYAELEQAAEHERMTR